MTNTAFCPAWQQTTHASLLDRCGSTDLNTLCLLHRHLQLSLQLCCGVTRAALRFTTPPPFLDQGRFSFRRPDRRPVMRQRQCSKDTLWEHLRLATCGGLRLQCNVFLARFPWELRKPAQCITHPGTSERERGQVMVVRGQAVKLNRTRIIHSKKMKMRRFPPVLRAESLRRSSRRPRNCSLQWTRCRCNLHLGHLVRVAVSMRASTKIQSKPARTELFCLPSPHLALRTSRGRTTISVWSTSGAVSAARAMQSYVTYIALVTRILNVRGGEHWGRPGALASLVLGMRWCYSRRPACCHRPAFSSRLVLSTATARLRC